MARGFFSTRDSYDQDKSQVLLMVFTPEQVVAAFFGLLSALLVLWRLDQSRHRATARKLEKCEDNHGETSKTLFDLSGRIGLLEGERAGYKEGVNSGVEVAVERVIKEIESLKEDKVSRS